jgi:hypothetical protein
MSAYLLLLDPLKCPACRVRRRNNYTAPCHNCGVKLFASTENDFKSFEQEAGIMYWWSFHRTDGWKARDHYMVEDLKPLHRVYTPPKLDKNYGRQTTPGEVAQAPRRLREKKLKIVK